MQIMTTKKELVDNGMAHHALSLFSVDVYTSHRFKHQFHGYFRSSSEAYHALFIQALFSQIGTIEVLALYQGESVPNRERLEPLNVYRRPHLPSVPSL